MDERNMMKPEVLEELRKERSELTMLEKFLQNSGKENERFTSIRNVESLSLADDSIVIPDIVVLESRDSNTQILNKRSTRYDSKEIESLSKKTGLEKIDIIDLMENGLQIQEIETKSDALPFKEISDSAAIREMIKKDISPEHLALLQEKGIEVVPLKDGSLQVSSLEKVAELDEQGNVILDQSLAKQLEVFESMGLISVSEGLAMQKVEPESDEVEIGQMPKEKGLKIVPLKEKQKEQTREELEKIKIGQAIHEDPNKIISVIRLEENRSGGSAILNQGLQDKARPVIIRLKGNKFVGAQELDNGQMQELQGLEATPVAKQVAALLKDTHSKHDTYLKPDEVQAGKTSENPNQDYTMYKIKMAGESKGDDLNNLLYIGLSGEVDMQFIENHQNGDVMFSKVPSSRLYPKNIYMENSKGIPDEREVSVQDTEKESDFPTIGKGDLTNRREILDELLEVEEQILEIESTHRVTEETVPEHASEESPNEESISRNPESGRTSDLSELPSLYSRRNELISKLGMSKATALKEMEKDDDDFIIGTPRQRPH